MDEILFLAHRIPYPPDRGDKMRSWHLLQQLATRGRVHLACFADDAADAAHVEAIRERLGNSLGQAHVELRSGRLAKTAGSFAKRRPLSVALFASAAMQNFVGQLLASGRIGTVFAFSGQMAQFVPEDASCRFVMDFVDADSAKFADYAARSAWPRSWLYRREARLLLDFECRTARRADVSLFVSEAEAALFRGRSGEASADVRALGNGIDLDFYDPEADFDPLDNAIKGLGPLITFTGQMDYRPNVEAVTAFAHDVMPLIRHEHGDAHFAVVGRHPSPEVRRLDGKHGVTVTGAVLDVRTWLAAADVVVAPLGIARGVQNKVLEAMAMARPVVASPAAFEGIHAQPERDLIVAANGRQQADAIRALLKDPKRLVALGRAARKCVEGRYRWKDRLSGLDAILGIGERKAAA